MNAVLSSTPCKAASALARRGLPVFPCRFDKKPLGKWKDVATTNTGTITQLWHQHPEAMIGIPTGEPSGVFVVDLDIDKDTGEAIGEMSLASMGLGHLLDTVPRVRTPSGGKHLYFRHPGPEFRNTAGKLGPGIDTRGDGGYVIAPGSSNGLGTYLSSETIRPDALPDLPDSLRQALMRTPAVPGKHTIDTLPSTDRNFGAANGAEVEEILSHITPDVGYGDWINVLMGLHDKFDGSAAGQIIADNWSAPGKTYKPGEVAAKWRSFTPGKGATWNSVCHIARQNGADLGEIARRHRGRFDGFEIHAIGPKVAAPTTAEADPDLSHDALARELGRGAFDQEARFVAKWGKWLFWNGAHWQVDDRLAHLTRTRVFLRDRAAAVVSSAERKAAIQDREKDSKGDKLRRWGKDQAHVLLSKTTVAAVESLARSNPSSVAIPGDFDINTELLGTPDGTVDLRTGELQDAKRGDLITKQTACGPTPEGVRPERWLQFLDEIFDGEQELISFMQRAAGYALTGKTSEHKLLFLYGTGRNGKSVFLNTLYHLWGDYARRAAAETFLNTMGDKHATGVAGLQGARLVAGSELPVGKTWDESVIKDLTGGDVMTARFMRGDFFDFTPQLTLMIAGNNQPSFRGVDEAIRARVVLVPFTVTIPPEGRDPDLFDKLKAEGPAILRWAIDGAVEWHKRGLDVPAKVAAASEEYMDDEDMLGQFLADKTETDPDGFVTTTELHQVFKYWAETQGLYPWSQHILQKEMKSRNWPHMRRKYGRGFGGLRMRG